MSFHQSFSGFQIRLVRFGIACCAFLVFYAGSVVAEDSDNSLNDTQASNFASVAMAWGDVRPLFFGDDTGEATGLGTELAYELGRELGFDVKPYRVPDFVSWSRDQNSGVSEILPMAAKLPGLAEKNHFSDVVFTSEVRFAVRVEDSNVFDYKDTAGVRIGVLPPGAGSDPTFYPDAFVLPFPNTRAALIALLSHEIDAIATESGFTFAEAQAARLDHRLAFVGPPLEELERVVIVHKSRADLLGPINEAITRMKADGRIDALVSRFRSRVPQVAPEVLQVLVAHIPPWMIVEDDRVAGFSVELIAELADRSGLAIEFVPVSSQEYFDAAAATSADLMPVVSVTNEISEIQDLTIPIQILPLDTLVRDADRKLQTLSDLSNKRVGGLPDIVLVAQDNGLEAAEFVTIRDSDLLLSALENDEIDAILQVATGNESAGTVEKFRSLGSPDFEIASAIGLRVGLGVVRERLNGVIPGFLLTDEYAALKTKYFGEPVFWTPQRITLLLNFVGAAFLLLVLFSLWQRQRQRRLLYLHQEQALEHERAHATELGKLVTKLELANREQAEFTYAVSHDLKSPSNTMGMLISELEEEELLGEIAPQVLSDMKVTNSRMGQLVQDVLSYSRIVHSELQVESINCNEMIDMIIKDLRVDVLQAGAKITRTDMPTLRGHPMQLRILFQNLVSNAVKFRLPDRSPVVQITSDVLPNGIRIAVSDNGIGIPSQYREHVFGMFNRLYTQSEYEGTGLGLAVCKRVVSNHGGNICIKSGPDGGTRVEITFGAECYVEAH